MTLYFLKGDLTYCTHITQLQLFKTHIWRLIQGSVCMIFWPYLSGVLAVVTQGFTCE